eukprot:GILJ01003564.1.p1 GENE.GILJ01003564.1~~GILJ01003564.1.p1  ORF type:complete len:405 (-),score=44.99 GILJ01003564.1:107-1285(-)
MTTLVEDGGLLSAIREQIDQRRIKRRIEFDSLLRQAQESVRNSAPSTPRSMYRETRSNSTTAIFGTPSRVRSRLSGHERVHSEPLVSVESMTAASPRKSFRMDHESFGSGHASPTGSPASRVKYFYSPNGLSTHRNRSEKIVEMLDNWGKEVETLQDRLERIKGEFETQIKRNKHTYTSADSQASSPSSTQDFESYLSQKRYRTAYKTDVDPTFTTPVSETFIHNKCPRVPPTNSYQFSPKATKTTQSCAHTRDGSCEFDPNFNRERRGSAPSFAFNNDKENRHNKRANENQPNRDLPKESQTHSVPSSPVRVPTCRASVSCSMEAMSLQKAQHEVVIELRGNRMLPLEDRKQYMKQLLLRWHPDKNQGNEDMATKMFQFIQVKKQEFLAEF